MSLSLKEKQAKLESLGHFRLTDTDGDYLNQFHTDYGFMSEDGSVIFNALTGELVISESFRRALQKYLDTDLYSEFDLIAYLLDEFDEGLDRIWTMNFPDRAGILFFNRTTSVAYVWDRDPDEEEEESLIERLITYGKVNLAVEWNETDDE